LEWRPKLNKKWDFTPIVSLREFLQLSRLGSLGMSRLLVQPSDMVDNSTSPCELISGWFSAHSTRQVGYFTL
jgi:hypothetical protein